MYGIFTYIYPKNDPNGGKYSIREHLGIVIWTESTNKGSPNSATLLAASPRSTPVCRDTLSSPLLGKPHQYLRCSTEQSRTHLKINRMNSKIDIFLFASPWPGKSCNVVNPLTNLPFGDDFSTHQNQNEKSLEMVYGIGFTMIYPLVIWHSMT